MSCVLWSILLIFCCDKTLCCVRSIQRSEIHRLTLLPHLLGNDLSLMVLLMTWLFVSAFVATCRIWCLPLGHKINMSNCSRSSSLANPSTISNRAHYLLCHHKNSRNNEYFKSLIQFLPEFFLQKVRRGHEKFNLQNRVINRNAGRFQTILQYFLALL